MMLLKRMKRKGNNSNLREINVLAIKSFQLIFINYHIMLHNILSETLHSSGSLCKVGLAIVLSGFA